jgi:transcriptional regulator with XRE-family HTH domain
VRTIPVNGHLLRAHRLSLGLGLRDMARRSHQSFVTIRQLEQQNEASAAMSLAGLQRVAEAAGITVVDLLTVSEGPPPLSDDDADSTACDPAVLGRILAHQAKAVAVDAIAIEMRCTKQAVIAAAEELNIALEPTGMKVANNANGMYLTPRDQTQRDAANRISQTRVAALGLNLTHARFIHDLIHGKFTGRSVRKADLPKLGELMNLGITTTGKPGTESDMLTEAAAYAFEVPTK